MNAGAAFQGMPAKSIDMHSHGGPWKQENEIGPRAVFAANELPNAGAYGKWYASVFYVPRKIRAEKYNPASEACG